MGALLLDSINQPRDLKQLNEQQVKQLCAEIRQFLLENISKTGGHLASNLGVVELTVALHRVLDTPQDKIVFDVGHQCYTHKILTGRRGQFDKLRQLDGISGFPNPNESEHDAFIAGHGNTALSLAIGMAWAKKLHHEAGLVVAVIGDGAFTGGMVYEGMNNIEQLDNLLVILNDNKMSISKNVGALARYLTHLRTTTAYFDAKDNVRSFLDGIPLVGAPLKKKHHRVQDAFASGNVPLYHVRGYGLPVHRAGGWPQRGRAGTHTAHHPQPARATFSTRDHKKGQGLSAGRGKPRQLSRRVGI